jgi:small-conductance mechanosensitive channel
MDTNFTGTYTSIAAIIVFILSKFGISTTADTILTIISAVLLVIGLVKQALDHKKLGVAAAAAPKV